MTHLQSSQDLELEYVIRGYWCFQLPKIRKVATCSRLSISTTPRICTLAGSVSPLDVEFLEEIAGEIWSGDRGLYAFSGYLSKPFFSEFQCPHTPNFCSTLNLKKIMYCGITLYNAKKWKFWSFPVNSEKWNLHHLSIQVQLTWSSQLHVLKLYFQPYVYKSQVEECHACNRYLVKRFTLLQLDCLICTTLEEPLKV